MKKNKPSLGLFYRQNYPEYYHYFLNKMYQEKGLEGLKDLIKNNRKNYMFMDHLTELIRKNDSSILPNNQQKEIYMKVFRINMYQCFLIEQLFKIDLVKIGLPTKLILDNKEEIISFN
jgi:hypothetical protein